MEVRVAGKIHALPSSRIRAKQHKQCSFSYAKRRARRSRVNAVQNKSKLFKAWDQVDDVADQQDS
jgi:hypothetical protein